MRKQYLEQLKQLKEEVLNLQELSTKNINLIENVIRNECDLEEKIKESKKIDKTVRKKASEIESLCIKLLSLQQPLAKDLRLIVTVLRILNDYQRISRNGLHTIEGLVAIYPITNKEYNKVILQLIDVINFMLQETYSSISKETPSVVDTLVEGDNIIDLRYDELSTKIYEDLKEQKIGTRQALALVRITRFLERIGDHICNIAERWFYTESGERTIIK
jgi:phosphate transport system protein